MAVDRHTSHMTNTRMFLTMLFGAVFRRRGRALMAVVASLVGAATLFCLAAVCIEAPRQINQEMRSYGANLVVSPIQGGNRSGSGIEQGMVDHTTHMVTAKAPARYATYRYETVQVNAGAREMAGIHPDQVRQLNRHWSVEGSWPQPGSVMVGRDLADSLGLTTGKQITIGYPAGQSTVTGKVGGQGRDFRVGGIVDTGGPEDRIIYADLADLELLTGAKRGTDVIEYSVNTMTSGLKTIAASINDMTSMGVKARPVTRITAGDSHTIAMLQSLFWLVSVVVLVLTFVGVGTTMASIVSQRRSEIGLRKALGASSRGIAMEFLAESACYGLAGGLIGTALGYGFARLLCLSVFQRPLGFNWWLALGTVLLSVAISMIASIRPVLRASRIDPALVLREE